MKNLSYIIYGVWVALAILSKILLGASWGVALSWLWLPLGVVLTFIVGINIAVLIGRRIKIKREEETPKTCESCLFGVTAQFDKDGKCLGESVDSTIKRPKVCTFYKPRGREGV